MAIVIEGEAIRTMVRTTNNSYSFPPRHSTLLKAVTKKRIPTSADRICNGFYFLPKTRSLLETMRNQKALERITTHSVSTARRRRNVRPTTTSTTSTASWTLCLSLCMVLLSCGWYSPSNSNGHNNYRSPLLFVSSFSVALPSRRGGRPPTSQDKVDTSEVWEPAPCKEDEARLIVLQITDVYTLEYFAHFKTLLEETRAKSQGAKVICMLTGDFLSPYLLSSVDKGAGMMHALNRVPMDYLTWGNHEADIDHRTVCRHVRNFKGKWLNSNMLDHEAMESQLEYDVVCIESPDGTNKRKVGLTAVLSDDEALYDGFDEPGAFGGATLTDPWEALRKYKDLLEGPEHNCDIVLPLQHLYVPDDHKTCQEFDFPVILSGHDHHRVDEVVNGTRLLKPGMNGVYATVLEFSWPNQKADKKPSIRARFVKCEDYPADPVLAEENERAYDALIPLRNTELARVPPTFEPLSSKGSRESVCTMGKYVCTLLRSAINSARGKRRSQVDAVLLMGGNIRGNADYEEGTFFSMEALEAEVKSDEVVGLVAMPGWLLAEGVSATHAGDPIPGWMQYDEGVREDTSQSPPVVTHVDGKPIDHDRIYRVLTKIGDLTNGQSPPWTEYYTKHPELLPRKGAYVNIHAEIMAYFARNLWRKIWEALSIELAENCNFMDDCTNDCNPEARLAALDADGDGFVSVEEMQKGFRDLLGYTVDDRETTLAQFVHSYADTTGDGKVTLQDFQRLCDEISALYESDQWRLSFPRPEEDNLSEAELITASII